MKNKYLQKMMKDDIDKIVKEIEESLAKPIWTGADFAKEFTYTIPNRHGKTSWLEELKKMKAKSYQHCDMASGGPIPPTPEKPRSQDFVFLFCSLCKEYVNEEQIIQVRSRQICERCIKERKQSRNRQA